MSKYQNTPITDIGASPAFGIGLFFGNVVLPIAMILFVILYFREDKNIYLYAILMIILFLTAPVWLLVTAGLFVMGLDSVSKWARDRHDTELLQKLK